MSRGLTLAGRVYTCERIKSTRKEVACRSHMMCPVKLVNEVSGLSGPARLGAAWHDSVTKQLSAAAVEWAMKRQDGRVDLDNVNGSRTFAVTSKKIAMISQDRI